MDHQDPQPPVVLDPHYHGPSDYPDTLNFAAMAQVVQSLLSCLGALHEQ